jgi:glycosyltransferase involved in cell wall biosynthesis
MGDARICLNMIVRNEAKIIRRALGSVADHISCWVISDTGSSDDTKDAIASFFAERGIPGRFCDSPFDTFEGARNRALDAARSSQESFDYILLMDADMQLRVDDAGFRGHLTAPLYLLQQRSSISYWNARLLRRDMPYRYRGVTHEYLESGGDAARLEGIWFEDSADGANRPGKFERDIKLLLEGLEKEPANGRYVYYLGQSYRDAAQFELAAQTYARRFEMGGWDEERWSALLNEARCRLWLGDDAGFLDAASRAFAFRSHRAEPLYELALFHRKHGQYETAMMFCELAARIPRPSEDRLFIEDRVYAHGIRQEISICGFYCSAQKHKDIGRLACNDLAIDPTVPEEVRAKARENLLYYAWQADELMPSWRGQQLAWVAPIEGHATNPSIVNDAGHYQLVVRVVNFTTANGVDYETPAGAPVSTRNFLLRLDDSLTPVTAAEILQPKDLPDPRFGKVRGFEDLRPFRWNDQLWGIATVRELNTGGWCEMVIAEIGTDASGDTRMADWRVLATGGSRRHEKKWMPRVVEDRLELISSADPTTVVGHEGQVLHETRPEAALDHLRGGSQLVPFDDGWLALTHEVAHVGGAANHLHRFVWFDRDDRLRRVSEPFHLNGRGISFAGGLAWHNDGERLIVSYGVKDATSWLATVLASDVRGAIRNAEDLVASNDAADGS